MTTGHDLAMALRVAYLAMHRRANAAFAPLGLTADQFVLLTALAEGGGVTQRELVRRTGSDPNTMSGMLARLQRRGLLVRRRHETDGRAWRVALTPAGRRLQRRAWDGNAWFRGELEALFPRDVLAAVVGHLGRIADGMSVAPQRAGGAGPPEPTANGSGPS